MGNKSGNKSGIVLGIVLATIVLVAAIGGASAYDCDWDVNPGDSIQAAIDNAAAGDTICVHAGTYSEWQIDVDKSITLIGVDGMENVIVDGTGGSNYLMKVSADEVTVSGFTLRNLQSCSSGVMIVEGSHCNISYNDIHQGQAFTFKMSSGTDDNILKGNTIYYASCGCDGMFTIRGTNHVVTDNTIGQQGGAIRVYCTGSLIYNNDFGTGISVPGTGNTWNTTYVSGENIIDGPYMGGSFYANYVGDDEYSGPNQDELGSDGIGDTPYGEDKLPLVLYECGCVGATQTFTCGDTVTESCTFNADMTCTGVGLVVGAPDIVIDGGDDHKLIGSATSGDCVGADGANPCTISGIYNDGNDNVVIKNLGIEGFCTGIAIKGTAGDEVRNNTVDNCEIHDNGFNTGNMATHGIHACDVDGDENEPGLTITNNDIYNNEGTGSGCQAGGNGVFIQAGGQDPKHEYCVISGNKLYDNAKAGFWTRMRLSKSDITYNNAWGNGHGTGVTDNVRGGIVLRCKGSNDNFVAHNEVSNNVGDGVGYGIYVGGNDNTIINNTANANTAVGICMGRGDGSKDNELRNNTVRMNDLDGIKVVYATATGNTLYDNTVCDNGQVSGVDIYDEDSTVGDRNRCDTGYNYNDTSASSPNVCTYHCLAPEGCVGVDTGTVFVCGDTVTESCTFNADMTCTGVGLVVGAPDIVIDGGDDHKLIGSATSGDCVGADGANPCTISGIYNDGNDNVVIKNLGIEGFCTGIAIKGTAGDEVRNNTVDNCEIHDNGFNTGNMATHGIHACDVDGDENEPGLTITNNDIYNNEGTGSGCQAGGNGVFIQAGGQDPKHEYCVISGNKLYDNAKAGFWTRMRLSKSDITYNNAWGNGHGTGVTDNVRGGIVLRCKGSNDNFVAHNEVSNNVGDGVGYGIYVGGNDNTIINNTANANTAVGICMGRGDGSKDNELRNNTVRMNDLDGIKVVYATATGNTLYDNTVCDNGQVSGVDIYDEDSTVGDRNRCDTGYNYNDTSASSPNVCMYQCMEEQPDLIIEDIRPIRWCCYCIQPSRSLKGGDEDEGLSVMFIDDPELAKEFSDDELRKEVAEALAKDPKLATEISAKLAGDDKAAAKKLSDPKGLAERCCRCNAIKELADLLDTELTAEHQHEMSDQLDMIVGGGCCGGCCCNCLTTDCKCCCCGRFIAYKIANVGDTEAGFSLSNLTVNGRVRSVDIVRPLDAGQRRWEVFPCYRMWWWPRPHVVTVCTDVTDWVAEGDETNNCRTEWFPSPYVTPGPQH